MAIAANKPIARAASGRGRPREPRMVVALAASIDGFIATPDGGVEWLTPYPEALVDFPKFLKTIGSIVMGRATYDTTLQIVPPGSDHSPFGVAPVYVLTNRPLPPAPAAIPVSSDVRDLADRIRRECPRGDVWLMGGGVVLREFLDAGLIDRWKIAVIPVILGEGIPLLARTGTCLHSYRLASTRKYRDGVIELCYDRAEAHHKPTPRTRI